VHTFFACSDEDRRDLESLNKLKGFKIPNGVDTDYFVFDSSAEKFQSPFLIYSGWFATKANQDAISYLVDEIWPLILKAKLGLRLCVLGGGMPSVLHSKLLSVQGVEVLGEVPDVRPHYQKASVSLVPLRIGSGTRLKILEAMSHGLPVVSTKKGAEGIEVENGTHIHIADEPADFAKAILHLLSDRNLFDQIRTSARKLVERKYDWDVIGNQVNDAVTELLETRQEKR
jgi:glycosyltransferase involved in cell wall biosynthesis